MKYSSFFLLLFFYVIVFIYYFLMASFLLLNKSLWLFDRALTAFLVADEDLLRCLLFALFYSCRIII